MSHADKAVEYYRHNFNCSQGIFAAYAVENGFDEKLALKIGTNFGGGARKGEMCGAVAGALMGMLMTVACGNGSFAYKMGPSKQGGVHYAERKH